MITFLAGLSVTVLLIIVLACVAMYVINSLAIMRALQRLGSNRVWVAWVPYLNYALLSVATGSPVGFFNIPMSIFRFWPLVYLIVENTFDLGTLPGLIIWVLCLGWTHARAFALLSGDSPSNEALGYASSVIPIIAWIKYFIS